MPLLPDAMTVIEITAVPYRSPRPVKFSFGWIPLG